MNYYRTMGVITGLMVGLILCVVLFKFANKDKRTKTEYDERQQLVRGKAYTYSFYTMVIAQAVLMVIESFDIDIPMIPFVKYFAVVVVGCIPLAVYSVWNDAYWGLNNDKKRWNLILIIAFAINVLAFVGPVMAGSFLEDGKLGLPFANLMVIVLLVIIVILRIVKDHLDKAAGEED